ncbi:MAG: DUF4234 domain-containing protein [Angustibacter sp.]
MTDELRPPATAPHQAAEPFAQASYGAVAPHPAFAPAVPQLPPTGPVGRVRGTGVAMLLYVITFGIYGLYWYFAVHDEMKRHKGSGLGGGLALVLGLFIRIVMPFLSSQEVGELYERRGYARPVSGVTGLWIFLPLVGGIVWFVKTNGALNSYWRSQGAL